MPLGLPLAALAAFAGALAATGLVVALRAAAAAALGLLLAGVAVALLCQAVILLLQYLSDASGTLRMVRWMMGGLAIVGWREPLWLLPWLLLALAAHLLRRWDLDLLLAGEEVAASRGVPVGRLRLGLLVVDSLAVAALVAVVGPIGFVGLMVPHMLRRLVGPLHRRWCRPACSAAAPSSCSATCWRAPRSRPRSCRWASSPRCWARRSSSGCCAAAGIESAPCCSAASRSTLPRRVDLGGGRVARRAAPARLRPAAHTPPADWRLARRDRLRRCARSRPSLPGKIVGIGRNYRDHAAELGNEMPGRAAALPQGHRPR